MFVYQSSTALVTGASKGLGEAFSEALAARGMNVVLVARSAGALQQLAERLSVRYGMQCFPLAFDLADPDSVNQLAVELRRMTLHVDLLINNAGIGLTGAFLDHNIGEEQATIRVNLQATLALSHQFGNVMAARGMGGIINLASNSAFQPLPDMATYAACKAFVLYFSEALNHEIKDSGVRVLVACPGPTATAFFDGVTTAMSAKDFDEPKLVVKHILRAFDQGKTIAYPRRLSVRAAAWLPRMLPRSVVVKIAGSVTKKMGLHN